MNIGGLRLGRVGADEIARLLEQAQGEDPTYDHVGSTLHPERWPQRAPYQRTSTLGHGDEDFAQAGERLRGWAPQRNLNAPVHPADAPIEVGTTLLVELRKGPLTVVVPNRIVEVVDDPGRRFGFAYGTLPGHAERGEESFVIELGDAGEVTGTVTVDAAPSLAAAKLAMPVVAVIQRWAVGRYLQALVVM